MKDLLNQFSQKWKEGDDDTKEQVSATIIGLTSQYWGEGAKNGMCMSKMSDFAIPMVFGQNAEMAKHVINTYKKLSKK